VTIIAGSADRDPCQARRPGRGLGSDAGGQIKACAAISQSRGPCPLTSDNAVGREAAAKRTMVIRIAVALVLFGFLASPSPAAETVMASGQTASTPNRPEPFPPPLRLDQLKEWALAPVKHAPESRVPFADNRLARVPLPTMPESDHLPMAGLSLVTLKNASGDKPYDLVAVQLSGENMHQVAIRLVNRSNQGMAVDYTLLAAAGGKANPVDFDTVGRKVIDPVGEPLHVELGKNEEIQLIGIRGAIDPQKVTFKIETHPSSRLELQEIVQEYESWGWRAGGASPDLKSKLEASVPMLIPSGAPIAFPTTRDAAQYSMSHPGVFVCGPDGKKFGNSRTVNTTIPSEYLRARESLFLADYLPGHPELVSPGSQVESDSAWNQFYTAWKLFQNSTVPSLNSGHPGGGNQRISGIWKPI